MDTPVVVAPASVTLAGQTVAAEIASAEYVAPTITFAGEPVSLADEAVVLAATIGLAPSSVKAGLAAVVTPTALVLSPSAAGGVQGEVAKVTPATVVFEGQQVPTGPVSIVSAAAALLFAGGAAAAVPGAVHYCPRFTLSSNRAVVHVEVCLEREAA